MPKHLTVAEAARRVRMSTQGVYAAIHSGALPAWVIRGQIFVTPEELRAWRRAVRNAKKRRGKKRREPMTDEEFIRRLWESDPD